MAAQRKRGGKRRMPGDASGGLALSRLEKLLADERVDRLYLCLGEENALARRAVALVERVVITEANRIWGKDDLVAGEASASDIMRAATQAPMLGGRRLVVVHEIDRLRKADKDNLAAVLDRVPDTTVLMLTASKLDGRTAFAREIKRRCTWIRCDPLADEVIPAWIRKEQAERYPDYPFTDDAVARLHLLAGNDLGTIASELEKLTHFVGEARAIRAEDVDRVVAGGTAASLADLVDALGERQVARALAALDRLLQAGTAPVQILAFLGYRLHDLWRAADTGGQARFRSEVRRQMRYYDVGELRLAAVALFEADRRLKSSAGSPRLVLETFVRKVAGRETLLAGV